VIAGAAGRSVRFVADSSAGVVVADEARLHQVVANLLHNAARHSPVGGTITVRAGHDAGQLVLEVADQGPGIPLAEREAVFERFIRGAERPSGGHDAGTGLGLAIAQWAVNLHGGSIRVVDADAGCRIRVSLPVPA
jgi:signal transduction histidine kinase